MTALSRARGAVGRMYLRNLDTARTTLKPCKLLRKIPNLLGISTRSKRPALRHSKLPLALPFCRNVGFDPSTSEVKYHLTEFDWLAVYYVITTIFKWIERGPTRMIKRAKNLWEGQYRRKMIQCIRTWQGTEFQIRSDLWMLSCQLAKCKCPTFPSYFQIFNSLCSQHLVQIANSGSKRNSRNLFQTLILCHFNSRDLQC